MVFTTLVSHDLDNVRWVCNRTIAVKLIFQLKFDTQNQNLIHYMNNHKAPIFTTTGTQLNLSIHIHEGGNNVTIVNKR